MMKFKEKAIHLLFPKRCIACGDLLDFQERETFMCTQCAEQWERTNRLGCPVCLKKDGECRCRPKTSCRYAIAYYHIVGYERGVVSSLIYRMKSGVRKNAVDFCADQLYGILQNDKIFSAHTQDMLVTSVPPGKDVLRTGVDHSGAIARALAKKCGLPYCRLLYRRADSMKQKTLGIGARAVNAKRSYFARRGIEKTVAGRSVLLIDDVMTTGATIKTCAERLHDAGAKAILVATVAKTYRYSGTAK